MTSPEQIPLFPNDELPPSGPRRRPLAAGAAVVLLAAVAGALIAHFAWTAGSSTTSSAGLLPRGSGSLFGGGSAQTVPSQNGGFSAGGSSASTASSSPAVSAAAKQIDPGLVDINTVTGDGEAAGTGMVVTSSGEVITNNHVISGATKITATDIGNGKTYSAKIVGYDRSRDIAVIQLSDASGLQTVKLGDSSTVRVGASVVTLGNAGGLGGTPSAAPGSVAGLNRSVTAGDEENAGDTETLKGVIQISGDLEPGDSGGPLVSNGKVVGMDTAASSNFSFQSSAAGQGFAIPIDEVLTISKQITAGKGSSTVHIGASALIGVYIGSSGTECGDSGEGGASGVSGALVCPVLGDERGVVAGSPAAGTAITAYDKITGLDGKSVTSAQALLSLMDTHHPGDRVTVTWVDPSGGTHTATVTLAAGPAD